MNFQTELKHYVSLVFNNQPSFIESFFPEYPIAKTEIGQFYMAGERCRVNLDSTEEGITLEATTIPTTKYIEWAESL